jgi:hypothetical protein
LLGAEAGRGCTTTTPGPGCPARAAVEAGAVGNVLIDVADQPGTHCSEVTHFAEPSWRLMR